MKHFGFLMLCITITLSSCGGDDDALVPTPGPVEETVHFSDIDIVTGIQMRDNNGSLIGSVANPNIKTEDTSIFPNPSQGVVAVYSLDIIKEYWITSAVKDTTFSNTDFTTELTNITYEMAQIDSFQLLGGAINSVQFNLDLTNLDNGYYRIFYLMENDSYRWNNLYINKELTGTDILDHLWDDWNP